MDFKIAVLAGDGIGPEISVQGVDVMNAVCEKFGHKVSYEYAICGADAPVTTSMSKRLFFSSGMSLATAPCFGEITQLGESGIIHPVSGQRVSRQ